MKLIELSPIQEEVKHYIERYQLYVIDEPSFFKTIPNFRLECWLLIDGGFQILDTENNTFIEAKKLGGYPATNHSLLFRMNSMKALNIKFKPSVLAYDAFGKLYPPRIDFDLAELLPQKVLETFKSLSFDNEKLDVGKLDQWIYPLFQILKKNDEVETFLDAIMRSGANIYEVTEQLGISSKTLERRIKKHFGLTPKKLLNIIRFNDSTAHMKSKSTNKLMDVLAFGYYDQSHFIRECKRITGLTPTQLFNKLEFSTNDLIVFNEENQV
ncbi:MAG: helix-turn-helix domain-containing protein [Ekhidna sp.]